MEEIKLKVEKRTGKGTKKELSTLRAQAKIPGVIYGGDKPNVLVSLVEKELMDARKRAGVNAILHLAVGDKKETVIIKSLQRDPVTDRPIHADLLRISLTQKIEAQVPIQIVGEAPGVKTQGGLLQHELRVLTMRGVATKIPAHFTVDVSGLELNGHVLVKELKPGADLEILDDPEHIVVHVTAPKEEVAETPVAAAEEGAAAPAEPELSAVKGKKDEEGKPLAKDAKAAPEKGKEEKK